MREVLCSKERALVILEMTFICGFQYNSLLWFPYYFGLIGYRDYAIYLTIIEPLFLFAGTLLFERLMGHCVSANHWVISILLCTVAAGQVAMIPMGSAPK